MKLAVIYWSGTGSTQMMAEAIHESADEAGVDSSIFEVSEFDNSTIEEYDKFALGCPACGTEELDEWDFQPFYDEVKEKLSGKDVLFFGSYGWGGGEWMDNWLDDAREAGIKVFEDAGVICETEPDDEVLEILKEKTIKFVE